MNYSEYTSSDFVTDQNFINWVLHPTKDDDEKWDQWLRKYPHKRGEVEEARRTVSLMQFKPIQLSDAKIERIKRDYKSSIQQSQRGNIFALFPNYLVRIAAGIAILVSLSWLLHANLDFFSSYEEVATANGQRIFVNLPDGSKVWLNGGSSIKYSASLNDNEVRDVYLHGEAFFEVAKNPKRPFLVHASEMVIKVVGTSFNVRSYNEDETIETTLVEGKVLIDTKGDTPNKNLVLAPNQKAVFTKESEEVTLTNTDPEAVVAWKSGTLVIENETFTDAARKIERWFGTEINIENGDNCRISLKIEDESLADVLELMQLTTKIKYEIEANKILLDVDCDQ